QTPGAPEPVALAPWRRGGAGNPHQRRMGGEGGGAVHSGFLNFSVMRSLSPIASYLLRSNSGLAGSPMGAVRRRGGRVSTPNGWFLVSAGLALISEASTKTKPA